MSEVFQLKCACGNPDCAVTLEFGDADASLYLRNHGKVLFFELRETGAYALTAKLLDWLGRTHLKDDLEHGMYSTVKDIVASERLFPEKTTTATE